MEDEGLYIMRTHTHIMDEHETKEFRFHVSWRLSLNACDPEQGWLELENYCPKVPVLCKILDS